MGDATSDITYSRFQLTSLVALRMLIGWHLLYEGVAKILNPYWTSAGYLQASQGPFADWFVGLATDPARLGVVDALNKWGLVLIGAALLLGFMARLAALLGAVLLLLFYLANPPLLGLESAVPTEGSYLFVNKVLIEMVAMLVLLAFPTSHLIGLDRLKIWERNHE
ncbi:MAG: DoxX family membrane protein [Acidobacteria bacterium]|nr:DoxX family membrane protein [Acidobacteriota bacterium]